MRGLSKKQQKSARAKYARSKRLDNPITEPEKPIVADPKMMVISNYENGSTYTKTKGLLAAQGIDSPPKSTYYRYQKKVNKTIIDLCKESIQNESMNMKQGSSISCDGAYAHRRNSSQCHAAFIDSSTGKIVAGSIVTKARKGGDFYGSSNMLETEAIRRNLCQIDLSKVDEYCHDRDNKTAGAMTDAKKNIKENIDPNHGRKWFDRCWKKLLEGGYKLAVCAGNCIGCIGRKVIGTVSSVTKNAIDTVFKKDNIDDKKEKKQKETKRNKKVPQNEVNEQNDKRRKTKNAKKVPQNEVNEQNDKNDAEYRKQFRSLKKHVKEWFEFLLRRKDYNVDEKKKQWDKIKQHIIGNHSSCLHDPDKKSFFWSNGAKNKNIKEDFDRFVDEMSPVFEKVNPKLNTNANESLHAEVARVANKNTPWSKEGYEARVSYAYLHHNEPIKCPFLIRERNQIPPNPVDIKHIYDINKERSKQKEYRSSEEYRNKESERRQKWRADMKTKKGDYTGIKKNPDLK